MSEASGWDAIDAALAPLYPDTKPLHVGTVLKYALGGPDPLDGLSAYPRLDPVPHWHIVTYGMSELYRKESQNPDESGWGFEFTFRLRRDPAEEQPPMWPFNFLQNLARYVFGSGNWFEPGHHIDLNGPIATSSPDTAIRVAAFETDPELGVIDTPHGSLRFLQVVGVTKDEYEAMLKWDSQKVLGVLAGPLPLWVTDLDRASVLTDPQLVAAVEAGVTADGSSTGGLYVSVVDCRTEAGTSVLTLGASAVTRVTEILQAQLPAGKTLDLTGPEHLVRFAPGDQFVVRPIDAAQTVVELPPAVVAELHYTLAPLAGTYRVPSAPGLIVKVERSEITNQQGEVVETVG